MSESQVLADRLHREIGADVPATADVWSEIELRVAELNFVEPVPRRRWMAGVAAAAVFATAGLGMWALVDTDDGHGSKVVPAAPVNSGVGEPGQPVGPDPDPRWVHEGVSEQFKHDEPFGVVDQAGQMRGFMRPSALDERDQRSLQGIIEGFTAAKDDGISDEDYDRLCEALQVLDPVEVADIDSQVAVYLVNCIVSDAELD